MKKLFFVILTLSLTILLQSAQDISSIGQNTDGLLEKIAPATSSYSPAPSGFWFGHQEASSDVAENTNRSGWFSHNTSDIAIANFGFGGFLETGHRYLPSHLEDMGVQGMLLTQLTIHLGAVPPNLGVRVYTGGTGGNHLGIMEIDQAVPNPQEGWNIINLESPVSIPEDGELWFTYYASYTEPIFAHSRCAGPGVPGYGNLLRLSETGPINPNFAIPTNFMIRGFAIPAGPIGTLIGHISSDISDAPLPNVLVSIEGTTLTAMTDAQGNYTREYIPIGTYSVTAELFGYETLTHDNVVITDDGTTTQDFVLIATPQVTVSGTVIGSDTNIAVSGATVTISGPASYGPVTTTSTGTFTIQGVTASAIYTLTISATGYEDYVDNNLVVGTTNLNLGDLMIYEFAAPPINVIATEVNSSTVNISWVSPFIPDPNALWFGHSSTDFTPGNGWGLNDGGYYESGSRFTSAHLQAMDVIGTVLTKVEVALGAQVSNLRIRVYTGGSGGSPGTMVVDQIVTGYSVNQWNVVELTTPVPIPISGELWITYGTNHLAGQYPHLIDNGPPLLDYGTLRTTDNGATWGSPGGITGNFTIRGVASNETNLITFGHDMPQLSFPKENYNNNQQQYRGVNTENHNTVSLNDFSIHRITAPLSYENTRQSRALIGYNIYRANIIDKDNPSQWVTLATNIPYVDGQLDYTFTDDTWDNTQDWHTFVWIVRSIYTNNNLSEGVLSNSITKYIDGYFIIGNESSTTSNFQAPFNYLYRSSVSQVIYRAEEIEIGAPFETIGFWMTNNNVPFATQDKEIVIWIANVDTSFNVFPSTNGWVPMSEFTMVYNGLHQPLPMGMTAGTFTLTPYELAEQFHYTGGNIVVMTLRVYDPVGFWSISNVYQHTPDSAGTVLWRQSDTLGAIALPNPINAAGTLSANRPNLLLAVNTAKIGHVSGVVIASHTTQPLANAEVRLTGTNRRVFSNEQGQYIFEWLPIGSQNLTVSRHGYVTQTINTNIISQQTVTQNITLQPLPNVTVSGIIRGSNTLQGLSGALITIEGFDDFSTETDANGQFNIIGVYSGFVYKLIIEREDYVTYINDYLFVGNIPLNLDIILEEIPFPPIKAAVIEVGTMAHITWEEPDGSGFGSEDIWISHTTGNPFANHIGTNSPNTFIKAHRWDQAQVDALGLAGADITIVEFVPRYLDFITATTIHIYTGGSSSPWNAGTLAYTQPVTIPLGPEPSWTSVELTTPFVIPDSGELWIGVQYIVTGAVPMGTDDGTPVLNGYGNLMFFNNQWLTLMDIGDLPYNWSIRAFVEGANPSMITQMSYATMTKESIIVDPILRATSSSRSIETAYFTDHIIDTSIRGRAVSSTTNRNVGNAFSRSEKSNVGNAFSRSEKSEDRIRQNNRGLEGYNIYRANLENISDETLWTTIATNVTSLEYLDPSWINIVAGAYRYIVKAVYTNGVLSPPAFTNIISIGMTSELVVNVGISGGAPTTGAVITLKSNDPARNPMPNYEMTVDGHTVIFPNIWHDTYTAIVTYPGYPTYTYPNLSVYGPTIYNVRLESQGGVYHEGFEGTTFPPTDWIVIDNDSDGRNWTRVTQPNHPSNSGEASAMSESWFNNEALYPDNWLVTPAYVLYGESEITWAVAAQDPDHPVESYSLMVSTASTDVSAFEQIFFETLSSNEWLQRSYDLSEYDGQTVYIAFRHHESSDMFQIKIDDVVISTEGGGDELDIFPPRDPEATLSNNQRHVILKWNQPIPPGYPASYEIRRGATVIAQNVTTLSFTMQNVDPGIYTYSVLAVYQTQQGPVYSTAVNTGSITVPGLPPRNPRARVVDIDNVILIWEAPIVEATGYRVWRNDVEIAANVSALTYTDVGAPDGDHKYEIAALFGEIVSERVDVWALVIVSDDDEIIIIATELTGNYPNPFNPSTRIAFDIKEEGQVRIDIFNIRGQRVYTLVDEFLTTGRYTVDWYGTDESGRDVASGIYFYRMSAEGYSSIKRMMLMK